MRWRRGLALVVVAVLLAACTEGSAARPSDAPAPSAEPSLPPDLRPVTGERLLVLMDDGSVITAGADGGDVRSLTQTTGIDVDVRHPVWSPDGRRVAWAELVITEETASSRIVTSEPDGSVRTEFPVDTATFFLQWDPTSSRIAYLGNFQGRVGMGVVGSSGEGAPAATTLGVGQPFYLSWSPEGRELLIHVGDQTLGTLDLEGNLRPISDAPGIFQAPVWLADGRMIYAATAREGQVLVVRRGTRQRDLVAFEGAIEFVVSPDGERIAYRVDDGSGLSGVEVVDVRSGRSRTATRSPTSAFSWSPDGRRLLLMTVEENGPPTAHRWLVWDGRRARAVGPAFLPSPAFLRDYVPFYGQFAQAMTPWSPDGGSFAFAGLIGQEAGVWVQELGASEPTFVVEGGSVVSWSPSPA